MLQELKFVLLAAVAAIWIAGCGSSHDKPQSESSSPIAVTTIVASRDGSQSFQRVVGTVEAHSVAQIQTKLQARVERIAVNMGIRVRQGQLLAELDTRDLDAKVQQARAVYEQAKTDFGRYETLLAKQATSQQSYDNSKAVAAVAESNLRAAEAMLDYATITAPFSGTITRKLIEAGDLAVPGQPLFELEQEGALRFVVSVPEENAGSLAVGDAVQIEIPTIDKTVPGIVSELSPSANPSTRSYDMKINLAEGSGARAGQFGRLLLSQNDAGGLTIPCDAIIHRGQLELVYIMNKEGSASLRYIRTGRVVGGKCEILAGLNDGETVIVSNLNAISDGQKVIAAK